MVDRALGQERFRLGEQMEGWISNHNSDPSSAPDDAASLGQARQLSGITRALYVQYLSAIWSRVPARLRPLVVLALDDPTTTDAVLGRLVGALVSKGFNGQRLERLVEALRLREPGASVLTSTG